MRSGQIGRQTEFIRTFVRLKPTLPHQTSLVSCTQTEVLVRKHNHDPFEYNQVFGDNCNNSQVFETVMVPIVDHIFEGYNACILAYGQTSSGKTYTMKGVEGNHGLIPLTIREIFSKIRRNKMVAKVSISYFQIYNQNVIDLLSSEEQPIYLDLVTDKKVTIVQNLLNPQVRNQEDSLQFYDRGEARRKFASNNINFNSSRSHTIFRIHLEVAHQDLTTSSATISMVDLAGSQSISRTNAVGQLKKQSQNINKSLLALSNVIRALGEEIKYINFRDSKLTRILQNCLTGSSKTVVICTVNQTEDCIGQTINTLKFGSTANSIKTHAQRNLVTASKPKQMQSSQPKHQELYAMLEQERTEKTMLNNQIARLKGVLEGQKQKEDKYEAQIDELKHQLSLQINQNETHSIRLRQLNSHDASTSNLQQETIAHLEESIKQQKYEIDRLVRMNREMEEHLRSQRRQNRQLEENQKTLLDKLTKYETELSSLQKSLNVFESEPSQSSKNSKTSKTSSIRSAGEGRERDRSRERLQTISQFPNGVRPQFVVPFQDNPYTLGKVIQLSTRILSIKIQLNEYIKANAELQEQNQKLTARVELLQRNKIGFEEERENGQVSQVSKPSRMSGRSIPDLQFRRMKEELRKLRADKSLLLRKVNQLRTTLKSNSDNYIQELTGFNRFLDRRFGGDQNGYFEFMFEEDAKDYQPIVNNRPN